MMKPKRTDSVGFAQVLRSEWTTFCQARGSLIAMVVAALVTVLLGLAATGLMHCEGPNGSACPPVPIGPGGEAVRDKFYFVHQPLAGDGSMTVRVTSLSGLITYPPPNHDQIVPGVVPWAKAGIMIKENMKQGSAYAAMMITGSHGTRMQYNFTQDTAGSPGGVSAQSPRWLRLTRSGDILTGYESTDGTRWTQIGTAHLVGLPATVQIGLFVTSPGDVTVQEHASRLTQATATFDHVSLHGNRWTGTSVGSLQDKSAPSVGNLINGVPALSIGSFNRSGDTFTVTGSGDVAPGTEEGWTTERFLIGTVFGLIVVIIVAVFFSTSGRLPGRIYASEQANPKPGRVLVAKAIVISLVTFTIQLVAAAITVQLGKHIMLSNGKTVQPVAPLIELRVVVGTAALVGVVAVFALALGALFQRRVVAVIVGFILAVLSFILANLAPLAVSQWLLRLTPAAGFAIQQSIPEYPQVIGLYTPPAGYYPLAPWAGFSVLCGYTALALGLAVFQLHRRGT
ncbi:hypothetical protein KSF_073530 [Reticulibacter mediterranei]|uniref:DUF1349 domain-containing protein n=1 Tax=Reticulibacter mediterranei TaxID=2778369 RepID=A0A8J3IUX1_9CHLR|nr:hypothetical protein [Reticulibacter mediterranei]GHO97305.1 hypothetical protein KSF_073530 [Reticulibacter mediterranei]